MRKGGGNPKGGEFERKTCKELSLWISDGERDDLFWRSAMSGGRATLSLKKDKLASSQAGDVSAIDVLGHLFIGTFVVECKFYKDLELHKLFFGGKTGIVSFWWKAKKEAKAHGKVPFMVAKQNFMPTILCLDTRGSEIYENDNHDSHIDDILMAYFPEWDLFIYIWDEFLEKARHVDCSDYTTKRTRRKLLK
ncbi:hypothetical protein LCGC14_0231780 [marine sediment metagenome]|uniref:Uncharacterized protein n=1 Tax=marine sediment metagenome TaxID=412755 RepID=A0A0F9UA46_9ZZZZ